MVTTEQICRWVEAIEREMIPSPVWVPAKRVFEYRTLNPETVAFLKMARAAQSLHALPLLAQNGLLSDVGAIIRVIYECTEDALFLVEGKPETKGNVDRFVEHFAMTTIDNAKARTHQPVPRAKIQNAAVRIFSSLIPGMIGGFGELEKRMKSLTGDVWRAWCHAVHSNYAEIMQMYGPRGPRERFQLRGRPREHVPSEVWEGIEQTRVHVALALWAFAMKLGLGGLAAEIERAITSR